MTDAGWDPGMDLDGAERWVDDWQAGIAERAAKVSGLSQRLAGLSATACSDDGLVEVTVGPSGDLRDLRLGEGIRRQSAATTAGQVLAVLRRAQARLVEQVAAAAEDTVGSESATGKAVLASFTSRLAATAEGDADAGR